MGGASKLPMLLSSPFPLLRPRPRPSPAHLSRRAQLPQTSLSIAVPGAQRHAPSPSPLRRCGVLFRAAAEQVHAQASSRGDGGDPFGPAHPWPEWVKMVEHVAGGGYVDRRCSPASGEEEDGDGLSVSEGQPEEFTKAAGACMLFARQRPDLLRLLPRRDIEVVVENGSPFLFKNAQNSVRRMKSFISSDGGDALGSEQAYTVDVMRYVLSYVSNSMGKRGEDGTSKLVEASVRSLLCELVKADGAVPEPNATDSAAEHTSFRSEQSQKPPEQRTEMKRGDWICPKCSFMNFARNLECLECKEARPRRRLTGEEWECPQCDFFNYGKNMACLRCDCKRPKEISSLERRFSSVKDGHSSGNEDLVEASNSNSIGGIGSDKMTESAISRRLDRILGRSPTTSETKDTGNVPFLGEAGIRTERRLASLERRDPGYVPFVPLPPDMFRKKPTEEHQPSVKNDFASSKADQQTDAVLQGPGSAKSNESLYSEGFNTLTVGKTNKETSDLSEGLSMKAAQPPDENNLSSAVSEDDFPEIMPMRKGENRFVISKKKDRSLTSPQYKRRIAMEQANDSNFVPFVPFPPGYFAREDKQPSDGSSSTDNSAAETSTPAVAENVLSTPQKAEENETKEDNWGGSGNIRQIESKTNGNRERPTLAQRTDNLWNNIGEGSFSSASSQVGTAGVSSLSQQVENPENKMENGSRGFLGKSLEGSAVTEPDPLDMSEEAKAQRWFRRVAQINDISELSQIPDEDFPEIMPMRKGVNRFVVSKRKTPLERRLTSPQYRRNLPIVSSEPEKDSS